MRVGEGASDVAEKLALQDALRAAGGGIVTESHNPYHRVWGLLRTPERSREKVEVTSR